MSNITTHVLDVARGVPASGISVVLEARDAGGGFRELGRGVTDPDGRLRTLVPDGFPLAVGVYRLTFAVGEYHQKHGIEGFYPEASIVFQVRNAAQHHHVPLLLSPFGYSTYRGS